jgi:hypothetical protein
MIIYFSIITHDKVQIERHTSKLRAKYVFVATESVYFLSDVIVEIYGHDHV